MVRVALSSVSLLGILALWPIVAQAGTDSALSGPYSGRDLRMETRARWDYQPGQGPYRKARDQDYFTPSSKASEQPMPPSPPVQAGDWRKPPVAESLVPGAPPSSQPRTETSFEAGIQLSNSHYHEASSPSTKIDGAAYGVALAYTGAMGANWFSRFEGRFEGGNPEYETDEVKRDVPNYVAQARATIGRDWTRGAFGVSPYVGIGYRYTQTDLRRNVSGSLKRYERKGQFLFAPIGVQPRVTLAPEARLSLTAEFSPLLQGWQNSILSDISGAWPDIETRQESGYGIHGALSYETKRWAMGPFVDYWNIGRSKTECGTGVGSDAVTVCEAQPHNHTLEVGLNLRYRFYP